VIPVGLLHNVQHLEGGIVSEIAVRNGDRVEKGDLLVKFSPSTSQSEYEKSLVHQASLELEAERLQAILRNREPDFSAIGVTYPLLASKQKTLYLAQLKSLNSQLRVLDAQIEQRRIELQRQRNHANSIAKEITILEEQVDIRETLNAEKIISRTDLLSTKSRLAEMETERDTIVDNGLVSNSALMEAKSKRLELMANFDEEIEQEAGLVASQLAEVGQTLVRQADKVQRLNVTAPVSGVIKGLVVNGQNSVVEPGQVILQIVPVNDEMIVESRVSPEDIGHVHLGQEAKVKVDSYSFSRFGSVRGVVQRISASTYLDERRLPYYRTEIALEKPYLGSNPAQLQIIPGMTVVADIKTGTKSILDYLLKPVARGFDSAFRER
jgi:HlyD family type I secretion membrane fusion protein